MIRDIVTDENILHQSSEEVNIKKEGQNLSKLILDMKDTLRNTSQGIGLSAIQVGEPKRMFVINYGNTITTYINPIISKAKRLVMSIEGCLSCPGKEFIMPRYDEIEVFYQNPLGKAFSVRMRGLVAKVFQHEYDHLSGVIISDAGLEYTDDIKLLSDEEKVEAITKLMEKRQAKKTPKEKQGEVKKNDE